MHYVNIKNIKLNNSEANRHAAMHYHNSSLMIDVIKNALLRQPTIRYYFNKSRTIVVIKGELDLFTDMSGYISLKA